MANVKHIVKTLAAWVALAVVAVACSDGDEAAVHIRKACTPVYLALYDGQGNDLLADSAAVSVYSHNLDELLPVTFREYMGRRYLYVVPTMNGSYQTAAGAGSRRAGEAYITTTVRVGGYEVPLRTYLHQTANGRVDSLKESSAASRGYQLFGRRIMSPQHAYVADMMVTRDGAFLCSQRLSPEYLAVNIDFYSPQGTNIVDSLRSQAGAVAGPSVLQGLCELTIRPDNSMPALERTSGWSGEASELSLRVGMGDWSYHRLDGTWGASGYTFELRSEALFGDAALHTVELTFDRSQADNRITGCAFDGKACDVEVAGFKDALFYGVNLSYYQK